MRSAGRGRRTVPVGEHPLVDGGDHLGRELRHRACRPAEGEHRVQVHQLEVAGVLPVVDHLEDARQRLDGDVADVPRVVGVAQGLGEVDGDAGHVARVLDAGGEGEVLIDAGLVGGLVHESGRAGAEQGCRSGAECGRRRIGGHGVGHRGLRRVVGRGAAGAGRAGVVARTAGDDGGGRSGSGDQEAAAIEDEPPTKRLAETESVAERSRRRDARRHCTDLRLARGSDPASKPQAWLRSLFWSAILDA